MRRKARIVKKYSKNFVNTVFWPGAVTCAYFVFSVTCALAQGMAFDDELSRLIDDFNTVKEELASTRQACQKLEGEAQVKQKALEAKRTQMQDLQKEKSALELQLKEAQIKSMGLESKGKEQASLLQNKEKAFSEISRQYQQVLAKSQEYETKLKQLQNEKAALQNEVNKFKSQELSLQSQGKELSATLQQLTSAIQDKEKTIIGFKQSQAELQKQQDASYARLKEYEPKISQLAQLQNEKILLQNEVVKLKSRQLSWQGQSQELTGSLRQMTGSIQEKERAIAQLEGQKAALEKQQGEAQKKIREYEGQLAQGQGLEKEKAGWQTRLKDLQAKVLLAESKGKELWDALTEKEEVLKGISRHNEQLLIQSKEYEVKLAALESEKAVLQSGLNKLENQEAFWQAQSKDLAASMQHLTVDIQEKEKSIAQLTQAQEELSKQQAQADEKVKDYENKLNQITQLQNEKTALQSELTKFKSQHLSWQGQSKELTGSIQKLTSTIQDKEKVIAALQEKGLSLESQGGQLSGELQAKENALQELTSKYQQAVSQAKDWNEKINQLVNEKSGLQKGLEEQQAKKITWQAQEKELLGTLEAKEKALGELTELYQRSASSARDLNDKLSQITNEKTELEKELEQQKAKEAIWEAQNKELSASLQVLTGAIQNKAKAIEELKAAQAQLLKNHTDSQTKIKGYEEKTLQLEQRQKEKAGLESQLNELKAKGMAAESRSKELFDSLSEKEKALADIAQANEQLLTQSMGYQTKLSQLEKEKTGLQAELDRLKIQGVSLEGQSQELSGSLRQLTATVSDKERLIAELKQSRQELLEQHNADIWQIKGFQDNVTMLGDEKAALQSELEALKKQELVLEGQGKELSASFQQLAKTLQDKEEAIVEQKQAQSELSRELEDAQIKNKDKERLIAELKQSRRELLEQHTSDLWQMKSFQDNVILLQNEKSAFQNELAALKKQENALDGQNKELSVALQQLAKTIQDKEKAILELQEARAELLAAQAQGQMRLRDYEEQLSAFKQAEEEKAALELRLKHAEENGLTLDSQSKELSDTLILKEKALQDFTQAQERLLAQVKEQEAKFTQIEAEKAALTEELEKVKNQEALWQGQGKELSASLKHFTEVIQEKEKIISELKQSQLGLSQKQNEDQSALKEYKDSARRLQDEKSSLKALAENLKSQKGSLVQQIEQLAASLREREKSLSEFRQREKELLEKQGQQASLIKEYEDKFAFLQGEKANSQNQLNDFKFREQEYKAKLDQLAAAIQDKEKNILELKQRQKELLARQDDAVLKIDDREANISSLEKENANLQGRLKEVNAKTEVWRNKNEEDSASLQEKDKIIASGQQREERLLAQVKNYEEKLSDSQIQGEKLREKNKSLFSANKFLKEKVEVYPRKLSQVALLKDRLLKENGVLHYNLGVFHIQRQEYGQAIVEFDKVLELNPNDPATHYNLGIIYADYLNDRPKAILHFKRYLLGTPKDDKDAERAKKYLLTWEKWEEK